MHFCISMEMSPIPTINGSMQGTGNTQTRMDNIKKQSQQEWKTARPYTARKRKKNMKKTKSTQI